MAPVAPDPVKMQTSSSVAWQAVFTIALACSPGPYCVSLVGFRENEYAHTNTHGRESFVDRNAKPRYGCLRSMAILAFGSGPR
jgi:hypothetical protein